MIKIYFGGWTEYSNGDCQFLGEKNASIYKHRTIIRVY